MVKIFEISGDGSNGGDPNKKPQEEENQNQNPQRQVHNLPIPQRQVQNLRIPQRQVHHLPIPQRQVHNLRIPQQLVQNLRIPEDLPDEINEYILALLERCNYPSLLCTSKAFRDIVTSSELFETRSSLGRTECILYAFIGFSHVVLSRWYILHRRNDSLRLSNIGSLPPMLPGSAVVTIGHDMYIIGAKLNPYPPLSTVIVIDCRFHTLRSLPDMRRARHHAAAGVTDGKIYVIGGCTKRDEYWVEVFDVNKETWETLPGPTPIFNPNIVSLSGVFDAYVVMQGKIYIWDGMNCLSYEPRRRQWESWRILSQLWGIRSGSYCVVDDTLYAIASYHGYPIVVYDPRDVHVVWRPVKGVRMSDLNNLLYHKSKMANFGGKLVILGQSRNINVGEMWCIVIALERRENGEIWGNMESKSRVLSRLAFPIIEHSRTVTL